MRRIDEMIAHLPQAHELVRRRICTILTDEIKHQRELLEAYIEDNPAEDLLWHKMALESLPGKIWEERVSRPNPSELDPYTALNVLMLKKEPAELVSSSMQLSLLDIIIECWSSATATPKYPAGERSGMRLQRALGVASNILNHPQYKFLGFEGTNNIIRSKNCIGINITDVEPGANNAEFTTCGVLRLRVDVIDGVEGKFIGEQLQGLDTAMNANGIIEWSTYL